MNRDYIEIGDKAFENSINLIEAQMPEGINKIGDEAFRGCSNLRNAYIPNSVNEIGKGAFRACTSIGKIRVPNGVKRIKEYTFADCKSLEEAEIEYGVEKIDKDAFFSCPKLKKISLPSSIESLDEDAFLGCFSLDTVVVPVKVFFEKELYNNPTFIKNRVNFDLIYNDIDDLKYYFGSLNDYYLHKKYKINTRIATYDEQYLFGHSKNNESGLNAKKSIIRKNDVNNLKERILDIPSGTIEIDSNTFNGFTSLNKVSIPGSVKVIGAGAFENCSELEEVELSEGVEDIRNNVFSGCVSLKNFVIPNSVKSIGISCFSGCTSLEDLTLGDNLETLGSNALYGCKKLKKITFPGKLKNIRGDLFLRDTGLEEVTLCEGIKNIEDNAFYLCRKLKTINLPDSLESIGNDAFAGCESLTCITLPKNVKSIGVMAFLDCDKLSKIKLSENLKEIYQGAFINTAIEELELPVHLERMDDDVLSSVDSLRKVKVHYKNFEELINFVKNNNGALYNFYKKKGKQNIIIIGPKLKMFEKLLLAMLLNTEAYSFSNEEPNFILEGEQSKINENIDNANKDNNKRYTGNEEINSLLNKIYDKVVFLPDTFKNTIIGRVDEILDEFARLEEELRPELDEGHKPTLVFITPTVAKENTISQLNAVLYLLERIEPLKTTIEQTNYYLDLAKGVSSTPKEDDFISEDIISILNLLPFFPERNKNIIENELKQILNEFSDMLSNELDTLFDNNALTDPSYDDYRIDLAIKIGKLKSIVFTDYDVLQKLISLQNGLNGIELSTPNELVNDVLKLKEIIKSLSNSRFKLEVSNDFKQLVDESINSIIDTTQNKDHFSEQDYIQIHDSIRGKMTVILVKIAEYNQTGIIEDNINAIKPLVGQSYHENNPKIKFYKYILNNCLNVIKGHRRIYLGQIEDNEIEYIILSFYLKVLNDKYLKPNDKISMINRLIKIIEKQLEILDSGEYAPDDPNIFDYLNTNISKLEANISDYDPESKEHIENFGAKPTKK